MNEPRRGAGPATPPTASPIAPRQGPSSAAEGGNNQGGENVASRSFWSGGVALAGIFMVVIGSLDFFQGLIAVIRDDYYVLTPEQIIVFDLTAWGWIMMIWG